MTAHLYARTSAGGRSPRDLETLFSRCAAGDQRAREAIIISFLPYARRLARNYLGRGEPAEDLYQAASVGLVKAVDGYEPARGESFVAYATPTIQGAIQQHFRDTTWTVHVPRSVRERAARLGRAEQELRATLGSDPPIEMVAAHLGVEAAAVADARAALKARQHSSLDDTRGSDGGRTLALGETLGELDRQYERVEAAAECAHALRRLPVRERTVLLLRFGEDLTQSEIARRIGVSQNHVSRLLRRATGAVAPAPEPG